MTGAGGPFVYHYDATGRMDYLIDSFGDRMTFSYDPADRLLVKQLANGARTSHTYDLDGRLKQLHQLRSDNVVLDGLTYDYNNVGVRKKQTDASGAIVTWTYDEIYQLTGELRDGPAIIDWETLTLGEWENLSLADWELMELNPRQPFWGPRVVHFKDRIGRAAA
jgi:YD repeat-containing protein